ncbi:hypothetical protein KIN20_021034 [Parelaphostrongylus tenuis]|uniref:Uncharacterized protein n=1 Tax=Parelaphostrongylus tenuis TaxID=148309 RepID=A0AAD5NAF0_PARTN|nr:hypothetical protein KIN20_021034 [Parelaphostrongylus tenuis]
MPAIRWLQLDSGSDRNRLSNDVKNGAILPAIRWYYWIPDPIETDCVMTQKVVLYYDKAYH